MAVDVRMPRFSDDMEEGAVSRWLKQVGDRVEKGEPIVEVETDKVIVEVEAAADGVLAEILAQEQEIVPVDGILCRIVSVEEAAVTKSALAGSAAPTSAEPPGESLAAPLAKMQPQPVAAPSNVVPLIQPAADGSAGQPLITPLARRIAQQLGIDLSSVRGSGIGGKIIKTDLQGHISAVQGAPQVASDLSGGTHPAPAGRAEPARAAVPFPAANYEEVAQSPLRRTVARRMTESKAGIPHVYMTAEVDTTEMLALRDQINAQANGRRITVNDQMIKAVALTLERVPEVNAAYLNDTVRRYGEVHIGFAVSIDAGLVTPVVRDCHLKSMGRIATEAAGLIDRAKSRKLRPDDLDGGTFTISNMGMFDVVAFSAIINPPQVGILAIPRPVERPVAVDGRVVVRSRLQVTLSSDHRAIDGVTAAAFLKAFKDVVENPVNLML